MRYPCCHLQSGLLSTVALLPYSSAFSVRYPFCILQRIRFLRWCYIIHPSLEVRRWKSG